MIKSEWLASYIAFGQCLNFTHAARQLHLSQPALHVQIAQLSEQLGVTLYERRGKSLMLTAAGRKLLAYARDQQHRDAEFVRDLTGQGETPYVALASGSGALLYLLGPALRTFIRKQRARLRILNLDTNGTLAALRTGEADVGVTVLDSVPDGLSAEALTDVWANVVMPEGHALSRKRRILMSDLAGESLVLPPAGKVHRHTIERALAAANVQWQVSVEANGWELMVHLASMGLGIAIVNDFCRIPRNCVARRLKDLPPVRYYRISREQKPSSAAVRLLIAELRRLKDR